MSVKPQIFLDGQIGVQAEMLRNITDRRLISSGCLLMSKPATRAVPAVGARMPQSMRIVVVLPEPFDPKNPKISPYLIEKLTAVDRNELSEIARQILRHDGTSFII